MKIHSRGKSSIALFFAIFILGIFVTMLYVFPIHHDDDASALTYQNNTDVSFTFGPMISISVSSDSIDISTLAPGTTVESDPIIVTVDTNTAYGYSLYADVGNDTDYNTTSLIHEDGSNNYNNSDNSGNESNEESDVLPFVFTSIATNASLPQLDTDNTWGYSFRAHMDDTTDTTGWSAYNGLPLYSTTENHTSTDNPALLIDTKDPEDGKSIDFKIAAKASATQASGTYNNVINFYAVGKPAPVDFPTAFAKSGAQKTEQGYYKMQDMTTRICDDVEVMHSTIRLQDVRDGKIYTAAKLKDNNCWMTENLNLAGGTEITSELSDVPDGYTLPTTNGFQSGNRLPESSQNGFSDNSQAYVYNTTNHTADCSYPGCYGYYSWVAATVGSKLDITGAYNDAPYSICPKGWKMPTTRDDSSLLEYSDLYKLTAAYGNNTGTYAQNSSDFYDHAGPGTVPNFLLASWYENSRFSYGSENFRGVLWSSTASNYNGAFFGYYLIFVSFAMNSASLGPDNLASGYSVRCMAK